MISKYLGFDSDYIIIGLCGVLLILFILTIVNIVQMKKLKKNYRIFMSGKDAKTLEDTLIQRLDQVDSLLESNEENDSNIKVLSKNMQRTYQKMGLIRGGHQRRQRFRRRLERGGARRGTGRDDYRYRL